MTAISAQSASQTSSSLGANRTVLLPGSPATYANRALLKGLGLRWDPEGHRWHGTANAENVRALREQLGLEVRCFGSLEVDVAAEVAPKPVMPLPGTTPRLHSSIEVRDRDPARRPHDFSRSSFESRIAFGGADMAETEEIATPTRQFSIWDITSGLPDDSREEDERREARHLRDLGGRVKHARAKVAATPGLFEALARDWQKAARFYGRFEITERTFRIGVPTEESQSRHGFSSSEEEGWGIDR